MKFICFCEEVPAMIGSKKAINRQPRKYTRWLAKIYLFVFTKKVL